MIAHVTCKNEEHPIKNEGARVFTTLYIIFSDAQAQINPKSVVVSGRNLNSSKVSCMSSLPARMKMIQSKMKEPEWSQHFFHYKSIGIFPDGQEQSLVRSGRILNSFETLWLSLLPAKIKNTRLKMKGARVFTKLYINFSDAHGQILQVSVVVFD